MKTVQYDESKYRLVPIEPTPKMVEAFIVSMEAWLHDIGGDEEPYKIMLASAPVHEAVGQEPVAYMTQSGELFNVLEDILCTDTPLYAAPVPPCDLVALCDEVADKAFLAGQGEIDNFNDETIAAIIARHTGGVK